MSDIKSYEQQVRDCFAKNGLQAVWYGGEDPTKIGEDPNKMYVAITEDHNWWLNKCDLRDCFFNYDAFKRLPLEIDCEQYGVYVIWMKTRAQQ